MATVFMPPTAGAAPASPEQTQAATAAPGLFRRILLALMEARQRQADREIAEILARRGGVIGRAGPTGRPQAGGLPG
jgi:hypothetical protein